MGRNRTRPKGKLNDALSELTAIDDALDLAGAPKADTRVGRIREWATPLKGRHKNPDPPYIILTSEDVFATMLPTEPETYGEHIRRIETAILRKVAAMARDYREDNYQNPIVSLYRELNRLAGDHPA